MRVLFASKCYGRDYLGFLKGMFELKVDAIGYPFESKVLMLNNGIPEEMKTALTATAGFTLDVEAMLPYIYEHFNLSDESFGEGKWYSVAELGAILFAYKEGYDYLCYVQGDCITQNGDWVTPGIAILEENPKVMVVSPASEVNTWHGDDGYDHYMSDQAWLGRVADLADPQVYHVEGVDGDYPSYGGNSFEHMVGKYLKQSGKMRQILPQYWTYHGTAS